MNKKDFKKLEELLFKYDFELRKVTLENKRLENEITRLYRRQNYGLEYTRKRIERVKKGL